MLKVIVGLVIALVVGVGVVVFSRDGQIPPSTTGSNSSNTSQPSSPDSRANVPGYIDYYDGVIAATAGQKIIFFHAPWCPQCRALEASIKAGQIPAGVTIIKTDYDSMQSLRQKYGVTIQTTLVKVDDQGNLIKKYVAYDEPTLDNLVKNLL